MDLENLTIFGVPYAEWKKKMDEKFPPPDFSKMTDEQLKKININTMLISEEEANEFVAELHKRGLVKSV